MSHVYTVTLDAKQIARLCETYALSQHATPDDLSAHAELSADASAIVRVSTKRKPRDKTAEAKEAA